MASYKLFWCLLTFTLVSSLPQPRRSSSSSFKLGNSPGFRFGEEYFTPEATEDAPEHQRKPDGCEKVTKESMVCMVCKDPDTSAKYEQCSYVPRKSDSHYSYSRSSKDKKPGQYDGSQSRLTESYPSKRESSKESREAEASSPYSSYHNSDKDSSESAESKSSPRNYDYGSSGEYTSESERIAKEATSDKCVEEKRSDGMTCMVCADPNTGGNFEKCAYAYEPSDKAYKYTKSKSFGYPYDKNSKTKSPKKTARRIDDDGGDDDDDDDDGDKKYEESKVSEKNIGNHCKEVVKDSMTCTICTDPKSGKNSENCSYSYDPADKLYTYSQSRSFGSPSKDSK